MSPLPAAARSLRTIAQARATLCLMVTLLAMHLVMATVPDSLEQTLYLRLGLDKHSVLTMPWKLLSHALLHGNGWHLLFNVCTLVLLCSKLEGYLGAKRILQLALYSTLAGALCHLLLSPTEHAHVTILIGASALVFALVTLLATLSPDSIFLPLPLPGKLLAPALVIGCLLAALCHPGLPTGPLAALGQRFPQFFGQIGHACHFGGALCGLVFGAWLLRPRISQLRLQQLRQRCETRQSTLISSFCTGPAVFQRHGATSRNRHCSSRRAS